jgi:hypothetical protein
VTLRTDIVALLTSHRLTLADEKALQEEMATVFLNAGLDFRREVKLSACDIVDFMVGEGVAVEVKIKGNRRAIYRQLERYCAHEQVCSLVLATNVVMGLPETIAGKPVVVANLGRSWL